MMSFLNDNKVYIFCIVTVSLVALYFLIDYHVRATIKNELKRMNDKKNRNLKIKKIKQQKMTQVKNQKNEQHDIDSYIDPAEKYIYNDDNNENDEDNGEYEQPRQRRRLSKNDIMMRDIVDN